MTVSLSASQSVTLAVPSIDLSGNTVSVPTLAGFNNMLAQLKTAMDTLTAQHARFGTNMQRLQAAQSLLQNSVTSLKTTQATLQDAPIPSVVADLSTQETVYRAVLETSASVLLPSLANYLNQIG
jgi:flagellar hook-associated protein 3 FlgL